MSAFRVMVALGAVLLAASVAQGQCETQKVYPALVSGGDAHGYAVDIDGPVAVAGSWKADSGGNNRGAAYVYRWNGTAWLEEQTLLSSDVEDHDTFGCAVAVSGNTIVVGAESEATNDGAAYVFEYDGVVWNQVAKLLSPIPYPRNFWFGNRVAIDGDTVVVADYRNGYITTDAGAVVVYEKPPTGWVDTASGAILTTQAHAGSDWFGRSIAIDGDEIIVGAPGVDLSSTQEGAAYVYEKPVGGWVNMTETAMLTAATPLATSNLGFGASIDAGVAVVGAPGTDGSSVNEGAIYVFNRGVGGWTSANEAEMHVASDYAQNSHHGYRIDLEGDRCVVGAIGNTSPGSAYLYRLGASGWEESYKFRGADSKGLDQFGFDLAMSGDTALFGAPGHDAGAPGGGAAHFFDMEGFELAIDPAAVQPGDTITFSSCGGVPGGRLMLVAVDVDGTPLFLVVLGGAYDPKGRWEYSATVPSLGTSFTVTFRVWGQSGRRGGRVDATGTAAVLFN